MPRNPSVPRGLTRCGGLEDGTTHPVGPSATAPSRGRATGGGPALLRTGACRGQKGRGEKPGPPAPGATRGPLPAPSYSGRPPIKPRAPLGLASGRRSAARALGPLGRYLSLSLRRQMSLCRGGPGRGPLRRAGPRGSRTAPVGGRVEGTRRRRGRAGAGEGSGL